ncbi:MAG: peptide deformylase [Actinomycetota bacterium]|nr:peptide deformylase [Actinomycetota bacterium]
MSIRKIRVLGDPVLREKSRAVDQIDDAVLALAKDMADSINTGYQGGVGLAAPQIGVNKRVIAINLEDDMQVYVNPEIEVLSDQTELEEEGLP